MDEGKINPYRNFNVFVPNSCRRDDAYVFYANSEKKFEYTNGATKCNPATEEDVLFEDVWEYQTASATLVAALPISLFLFGDIYEFPYVIKKLTEKELVLELYESKLFADPSDISYRITLSAQ